MWTDPGMGSLSLNREGKRKRQEPNSVTQELGGHWGNNLHVLSLSFSIWKTKGGSNAMPGKSVPVGLGEELQGKTHQDPPWAKGGSVLHSRSLSMAGRKEDNSAQPLRGPAGGAATVLHAFISATRTECLGGECHTSNEMFQPVPNCFCDDPIAPWPGPSLPTPAGPHHAVLLYIQNLGK